MIQPWKKTGSRPIGDFRIFSLRADTRVSPRTGAAHEVFVLDCVNWVNVIAVTPDDQLVMVEQFRFGSETVELEIPGGMMDKNETDPVVTGVRELREETGYEGERARLLGDVLPNPAIMSNTCYTVIVENCQIKQAVQFDAAEDIVTRLVPVAEIPKLIAAGKIRHSLVVVALYYYDLLRRGIKA
jgi:8-oxo-dGTP pyrophosphatase MutT (NUDIX family)